MNRLFILGSAVLAASTLACAGNFDDGPPDGAYDEAEATMYQAEDASARSRAKVRAAYAGYTGSGYIDFGSRGSWLEWDDVRADAAGDYEVSLRYAVGTSRPRPVKLIVNGAPQERVRLSSTGSWTSWKEARASIPLRAGRNTVRILVTGKAGPNLDRMAVLDGGDDSGSDGRVPRALYTYSFGGLEEMPVGEATELLTRLGYAGVAAGARTSDDVARLEQYQGQSAARGSEFALESATLAHRFDQYGFDDTAHRAAIDRLSGREGDLWVWFRDSEGVVSMEELRTFVGGILDYASANGVRLVLYPHSGNIFDNARDAMTFVESFDNDNFGVAVNLTHEIRAGNGDSLAEVFDAVRGRIFAITLSGINDREQVLSLDESELDLRPYLRLIKSSGFEGPIGFLNFKLDDPADYLQRTMERWIELCHEVGLYEPDSGGGGGGSADGLELPIEVLGPAGTKKSVTFQLDDPAGVTHLYVRCNACGYHDIDLDSSTRWTKASVRVNGGPAIAIKHFIDDGEVVGNRQIQILGVEGQYGGIGGGFRTVRMTIPITGLVRGDNTLEFEHVRPAAPSIGFRIIELNLLRGGSLSERVLSPEDFAIDDPSGWRPPREDASEIADGQRLWTERNRLYDVGLDALDGEGDGRGAVDGNMIASCSDCHARDGRDLKYFNYSNLSIIERSKFHGMTQAEGEKIASYIRALDIPVVPQARPWNPPYQPGPGMDARPVFEWAAGAGVDAILDDDADMASYLFPSGTSLSDVRAVVDRYSTLNMRELPVAIPMPEWNQWLPLIHPDDAFDTSASSIRSDHRGNNVGEPYYDKLYREARGNPTPETLGSITQDLKRWIGRDHTCQTNKIGTGESWRSLNGSVLTKLRLPARRFTTSNCEDRRTREDNAPYELAKQGLAGWIAVKQWELIHGNGLEEEAARMTQPVCSDDQCTDASEVRGWVMDGRNLFDRAPHFIGNSKHFVTQNLREGLLDSNAWYHLNMIINPGYRVTMPSHFAYTHDHVAQLQRESGVEQPWRFWAGMIKMRQLQTNGRYGVEAGLDLRTAQPAYYYGGSNGTRTHEGVGRALWRYIAQAMIEDFVADADNATAQNWADATANRKVQPRDSTNFSPCDGCSSPFDGGALQGRNTFRAIPLLRELGVSSTVLSDLIDWGEKTWPRGPWDDVR